MYIPHSLKGVLFGPTFIGLTLILKVACPASVGSGCFADALAVPIFLPLILVYKNVGEGWVMYHELWFIFVYWSIVGLLVGFIFDLRTRQSPN